VDVRGLIGIIPVGVSVGYTGGRGFAGVSGSAHRELLLSNPFEGRTGAEKGRNERRGKPVSVRSGGGAGGKWVCLLNQFSVMGGVVGSGRIKLRKKVLRNGRSGGTGGGTWLITGSRQVWTKSVRGVAVKKYSKETLQGRHSLRVDNRERGTVGDYVFFLLARRIWRERKDIIALEKFFYEGRRLVGGG